MSSHLISDSPFHIDIRILCCKSKEDMSFMSRSKLQLIIFNQTYWYINLFHIHCACMLPLFFEVWNILLYGVYILFVYRVYRLRAYGEYAHERLTFNYADAIASWEWWIAEIIAIQCITFRSTPQKPPPYRPQWFEGAGLFWGVCIERKFSGGRLLSTLKVARILL